MVQKRPFVDEELLEASAKHPRQLEHNNERFPFLEFVPSYPALQQAFTTGEGRFWKDRTEGVDKLACDTIAELPACMEDIDRSVSGCLSISPWTSSGTIVNDVRSAAVVDGPFSPEDCNSDHLIMTNVCSKEIYSLLLADAPHKSVPSGKDYQAEIPTWSPQGTANTSDYMNLSNPVILLSRDSDLDPACDHNDEKKLMGTCIIPMPNSETSAQNACKIGNGKTDCSCHDIGSVRCIRQHITEAREKLRRNLGQDRFLELGFSSMGEEVSEKWSDDEEQLFYEVVFSNPSSTGKNFWDNLSVVFPSRTRKDIVSYYFNVFMLRRRAEQNRCDQMNIDSDNDEWQGSDDYSEGEFQMRGEDEDSVESPVYEGDPGYEQNLEDDVSEYDEDGINEACYNDGSLDCGGAGKCNDSPSSDLAFQLSEENLWKERDDHDVQDDSCTSSDTAQGLETNERIENGDHSPSDFNGLHSGIAHGGVAEPCDAKVWDTGYMTCPENEIDFLPGCNVIGVEEGDAKDFC